MLILLNMGCSFDLSDDFEKCQLLLAELEDLLDSEQTDKLKYKKNEKHQKEKEELKIKIKTKLEYINDNLEGVAQIDKLQKLNRKFQNLLAEESKMGD